MEGVTAKRAESLEDAFAIYGQGQIPVMIDENGSMIQEVQPPVVVDAILAKRNLGTKITDALQLSELDRDFVPEKMWTQ